MLGKGININFFKKTSSHNAGSQKFENSRLSFASSQKPGITLYF